LKKEGIPFKLALLGESYKKRPPVFLEAERTLKENIIHSGYIDNHNNYINFLKTGDIVISTANQENFGIAIIEAILAGCRPLLPTRLSYPEIIPSEFHYDCLYDDKKNLENKLKIALKRNKVFKQNVLIDRMSGLCWNTIIKEYDSLFTSLIIGDKIK
ncbi:MAG: glycosyltransferase, partial [Spirochaetales bacterium]|nr:glycosyltransferase [Spirochaetales bacterium]